jgi:hypothetical protein
MDPSAFRSHFGTPAPDVSGGARLAALRLTVREAETVRATLRNADIEFVEIMARLVVAPEHAMGATLAFEAP